MHKIKQDNREILVLKEVEFQEWLNHPVTKALLEEFQERSEACKAAVSSILLEAPDLDKVNKTQVAQIRGQHFAHEEAQDIRNFLITRLQTTEVINEEDKTQSQS